MEIEFTFDKKHNKYHYQVNHSDISENEILEVFGNRYVDFIIGKKIGIIGHTNTKRFLVIIGCYGKKGNLFRVITAYPAKKKYLIYYKKGLER